MNRKSVLIGVSFVCFLLILFVGGIVVSLKGLLGEGSVRVENNSVLVLEVQGVIFDSKKILTQMKKYAEDTDVKAIVIRIDSPGGVVGPSQEIYQAVLDLRNKHKKTVVASLGSVAASGGYYIAAACDKIVTNPGTLTGSIGVIMEFADLSKLYDWAKVSRYVIKTGPFKDTGADFRPMSAGERDVMQNLINNVFMQFKKAVSAGRSLKIEKVSELADGRIYSGEQAVKLGLADREGGLDQAIEWAAELAGVKNPEPVYPPKSKPKIWDFLRDDEDAESRIAVQLKKVLHVELIGKPLFLYPGALSW